MVGPQAAADLVSRGDQVAWLHAGSRPHPGWVTARGDDPEVVVDLVSELVERHQVSGYTVPEIARDAAVTRLGGGEPRLWCWWVREQGAAPRPPGTVLALDDPRIGPLLTHSASAYVLPGDQRIIRWAGVDDGRSLVAVAGAVLEMSGAWHLVSVCTHPDYRAQGYAAQACGVLIDEAQTAGAPAVVLEMYSDNEAGRRLYRRLGFSEEARFLSCVLDETVVLPF